MGGAWAFDSEASAGHTVPDARLDQAVPVPVRAGPSCGRTPTTTSTTPTTSPTSPVPTTAATRSGPCTTSTPRSATATAPWSSLDQYVEEAQVQNYETQRAEFEAYIDHSTNAWRPSTGIVYWQLNKGWPTLLWDLYNHDFDQAGSYFGAKKANEPLHVLYAYDTGTVSVDNLAGWAQRGLSVESKVYSVGGTAARRPDRERDLGRQPGSGARRPPSGRAGDHLPPPARPTSSSCCSRATVRSSTATSTGSRPSRTWSTGTRRSATRRRP